jgi:hypothetical protein
MANNEIDQKNANQKEEPVKKKKGFWGKVGTFMMMGGFMLVLIVVVLIAIAISMMTKSC